MSYQFEDQISNTSAAVLGIAIGLDGLAELDEFMTQGIWYQISQSEDRGHFSEKFSTISAEDLWRDIEDEVMNDLKNYASAGRQDGVFQEKEEAKCKGKKGKLVTLSEDINSKEASTKQVAWDDTGNATINSKLSRKPHTTKQCMRVQVLKGLVVKKAKQCWKKNGKIYSRKGRGLCCTKNCWMGWEHVDLRRILLDWSPW